MNRRNLLVSIIMTVYIVSLGLLMTYLLIGYFTSDVASAYMQASSALGSKTLNVSKSQFRQEYEELLAGDSGNAQGSGSATGVGIGSENKGSNSSNDSTIVGNIKFLWPVPGFTTISSRFGERAQVAGTTIDTTTHNGLDITGMGITGSPILAVLEGVVQKACVLNTLSEDAYSYAYGNYVVLEHSNGLKTVYAHCTRVNVSAGEIVHKGQQIATVGNTGQSSGPHLHIAVINAAGEFEDPAPYLGLSE